MKNLHSLTNPCHYLQWRWEDVLFLPGRFHLVEMSPLQKAIEARALPVSSMAGASEGALVANSGKFAKSKDQSLTLADANKSFEEIDAEFQQAYAVASNQFVPISTEHADLKPYVGRWTLEAKAARGGMQRVGSYQGRFPADVNWCSKICRPGMAIRHQEAQLVRPACLCWIVG